MKYPTLENSLKMKAELENSVELFCGVCGSSKCWEFITREDNSLIRLCYNRGALWLCEKCWKDSLFFDNIAWTIMKPVLKMRRFLKL
jgi:hypothetical protein